MPQLLSVMMDVDVKIMGIKDIERSACHSDCLQGKIASRPDRGWV
jgi:hypothetical protein